jgi:hypothetical protein
MQFSPVAMSHHSLGLHPVCCYKRSVKEEGGFLPFGALLLDFLLLGLLLLDFLFGFWLFALGAFCL